ncbi:MAG: winged helix-turn-helix domain-containing protein [Thalassotalea sp.]
MRTQFIGDNFFIDCQEHYIDCQGVRHEVRPKTFQLLLILIERQNRVIDKQTLLNEVWDDVTVDEQVIFQSIGEIRKIFIGKKVIQTHPRKGYSWIASIEKKLIEPVSHTERENKPDNKTSGNKYSLFLPVLTVLLLLALLGYFIVDKFLAKTSTSDQTQAVLTQDVSSEEQLSPNSEAEKLASDHNTIFILPTKNNIIDRNFDWVAIGIMDTLISQAKDHSQVMPLDYVLQSMRNAKMQRNYNQAQIKRLFKITGAATIVETEITRTLDEYRLIYKLHFVNNTKREVIFSSSIENLITELGKVIANLSQSAHDKIDINYSDFNHELFVEALTLAQQGKLAAAIQLMKGLISVAPENIQAYKVLNDWYQYQEDFQSALEVSQAAIDISAKLSLVKPNIDNNNAHQNTHKQNIALASIYYRHAYNLFRLGKITSAWHYAKLMEAQLQVENNPFYHGFSSQLAGELQLAQDNYQGAKNSLQRALKQFERISYSIGMTSVHCLLAITEQGLGNSQASENHLAAARKVVKDYEIEEVITKFKIDLKL